MSLLLIKKSVFEGTKETSEKVVDILRNVVYFEESGSSDFGQTSHFPIALEVGHPVGGMTDIRGGLLQM
jgi:hypothetical protein